MNHKSKVTATYTDYPSTIEKAMVEIGTNVYQTITPIIHEEIIDDKVIKTPLVEFKIIDERIDYIWSYVFDKLEMKQFITLLQKIQSQNQTLESSFGNSGGDTGCNKPIIIRH